MKETNFMKQLVIISLLLLTVNSYGQNLLVNPLPYSDNPGEFIVGGYGEILYQHMDYGPYRYSGDGAPSDSRATVSLPRMVISLDYKFKHGIAFSTEIEFENGGTGSTYEYEYDESGEWEMEIEKGGEVVLEQFYLSKHFSNALSIKLGHIVVPIGVTNRKHVPTQFFGTVRPEGESTIIPLTWHETGISFIGQIGKWSYEAQLINGLDANGMSSEYWIKKALQTQYETVKMNSPAVTVMVGNRTFKNLSLNGSFYRGNSAQNSSKPEKMEHIDGTVTIGTFDFEYRPSNFIVRGNVVSGTLTDSQEIGTVNVNILSRTSPYTRTPPGSSALTYSAEMGYNIFNHLNTESKLYAFGRYEYYNSMHKTEGSVFQDPRYHRQVTTFGLNYLPTNNVVVKLDYAMRSIDSGNYNSENTVGLSVAYSGVFTK